MPKVRKDDSRIQSSLSLTPKKVHDRNLCKSVTDNWIAVAALVTWSKVLSALGMKLYSEDHYFHIIYQHNCQYFCHQINETRIKRYGPGLLP